MAGPRKLPDNEVLRQLRIQKWTYEDIATQYGVTATAVYLRLKEAKAVTPARSHKELLPWTIRKRHIYAHPAAMLRYYGVRLAGDSIPEKKAKLLDRWLEMLKAADVVVCYNEHYPPNPASPKEGGFHYVARRPEDGDSLTREECTWTAETGRH